MLLLLWLQFIAEKANIVIPPDMLVEEQNDMVWLRWMRLL